MLPMSENGENILKNVMIDKSAPGRDFIPLFSGEEQCANSHTFGPFVRDYYLIHFCLSGRGILHDKYGEHRISAGELFIIREGETTTYQADEVDPWHYLWIATVGKSADTLEDLPSVIGGNKDFFLRIKAAVDENETDPNIYCAFLYELLHLCSTEGAEKTTDKLSNVKRYIKYNYMMDINVDSISHIFGFERSYLYRIFKRRYGIGVKEYIVKVRMEKAKELLCAEASVREAAELVGYSDQFSFSKAFKTYSGSSPLSYKKEKKPTA